MSRTELNFVALDQAVTATLGASYTNLAKKLLSPNSGVGRISDGLAPINSILFCQTTLDGSIVTTNPGSHPGLVADLSDALNRPLRSLHPNIESQRARLYADASHHLLNAHLTQQLPPILLSLEATMHLPTLLASSGRNADIVHQTEHNPDLVLASYYHLLRGYLCAINQSQTLALSLEDLGRLSVIRLNDLEAPLSQGITISVFSNNQEDNWSSILTHRAKYQRAKLETHNGVVGFWRDNSFYNSTTRMEHSPGSVSWWAVFVARLARTWADRGLSTNQIDLESLARHRPTGSQVVDDPEAIRYTTANLTVAEAYDPALTHEIVRATNLTPLLRQNTTVAMRRSLHQTDIDLFASRSSRRNSLTNDTLVDGFARNMPAKLSTLRDRVRLNPHTSHVRQNTVIKPYKPGRVGNNFMYLSAQDAITFLRHSALADKHDTHEQLDYLYLAFTELIKGASPSEV